MLSILNIKIYQRYDFHKISFIKLKRMHSNKKYVFSVKSGNISLIHFIYGFRKMIFCSECYREKKNIGDRLQFLAVFSR